MKRAELIEKWLEALESGKCKQGRERLYRPGDPDLGSPDLFCCLGVLYVIAGHRKENMLDKFTLPRHVALRVGINEVGTFKRDVYHAGRTYESLAEMNDSGVRFTTIARIIREQLAKDNFKRASR